VLSTVNPVKIEVDGQLFVVDASRPLLSELLAAGIDLPHLCHDERLKPIGACRLCVVELEGVDRPRSACEIAPAEGLRIRTKTTRLEALRRTNLSLLARNYPPQVLDQEPNHPFHRLLTRYQIQPPSTVSGDVYCDESHPLLRIAMDRCIHCFRCVQICRDLQGADVWQVWARGPETRVVARSHQSLLEAGCVSCGACSDTCPTGAIADRNEQVAEAWTDSTCVYCGVGCQLKVGTRDRRVVSIRPAAGAVNHGHLCVKGRYGFAFNHSPERITKPLIRDAEGWREVGWDVVLDELTARLKSIMDRSSTANRSVPLGMLGSSRATNEENYYIQKFARVVLRNHHVDCCARVCHQPTAAAMKTMLGTGAATNGFDDIELARTLVIAGCNPAENHPIVGARIRQAVRRGARLIVIDPRRTELAEIADLHLAVQMGGNIPLLNAMAFAIVEEGLEDQKFIAQRVDEFETWRQSLSSFAPERVASYCGVEAEQIREAARLYASEKPAMCLHGLGITEHLQGTEGVMALVNLALLTGNLGMPGAGINPLRGQNNVQGAAHMGCEPKTLPGGQSLDLARSTFESAWGVSLSSESGLDLLQMVDAAQRRELAGIWSVGYDIFLTLANADQVARSLQELELVVVQDLFMNETAKGFAHLFLPAASVFEKDGTFMNSDRRIQRIRAALEPLGEARPDTWIIAKVAQRLGFGEHFAHNSAEAIWDEIRQVWPAGAGLSYDRLTLDAPPWPCPTSDHPGTRVLHSERFAHGTRTKFRVIPWVPSPETTMGEFPFRLSTGRHLYQFNAGTMTQRTRLVQLQSEDCLEISQGDAARLGISDGERVHVVSRHGRIELPVRLSTRVRHGELFTSFHDPALFVNRVTSPVRDRMVNAPEYKLTAVRIERIGKAGSSSRQA
jgi:formate dehydrogenase major subunit